MNKELKLKMNFNEMKKIIDMANQNVLFSNINVSSLIINGRILEEKMQKSNYFIIKFKRNFSKCFTRYTCIDNFSSCYG